MLRLALYLLLLAEVAACAPAASPASYNEMLRSGLPELGPDAAAYNCPSPDPAQPNCRVPR